MFTIALESEIVTACPGACSGWIYRYEDGSEVWSLDRMSAAELECHKKYFDQQAEYMDEEDYEPYYTLGEPRMAW